MIFLENRISYSRSVHRNCPESHIAGGRGGRFWTRGRRFCDIRVEAIPFLWLAARETGGGGGHGGGDSGELRGRRGLW